MQTLMIEVESDSGMHALHQLEEKQLIKIVNGKVFSSPSIPGEELSLKDIENWIQDAETSPTITLQQAKLQWAKRKERLQQLYK